jgi:hypothetical protein
LPALLLRALRFSWLPLRWLLLLQQRCGPEGLTLTLLLLLLLMLKCKMSRMMRNPQKGLIALMTCKQQHPNISKRRGNVAVQNAHVHQLAGMQRS